MPRFQHISWSHPSRQCNQQFNSSFMSCPLPTPQPQPQPHPHPEPRNHVYHYSVHGTCVESASTKWYLYGSVRSLFIFGHRRDGGRVHICGFETTQNHKPWEQGEVMYGHGNGVKSVFYYVKLYMFIKKLIIECLSIFDGGHQKNKDVRDARHW